MKLKKTIAVILSLSVILSFAGCDSFGSKKEMGRIQKVIDAYAEALADEDADEVIEQTDFGKKDEEWGQIQLYLDNSYYEKGYGETGAKIFKYIISTIEIDYDINSAEISKDEASVKVKYKMVDWEQVLNGNYPDYDYLLKNIKKVDDTTTVKGKIELELIDGEWKITKLSNFEDIFKFILALPYNENNGPTPTPPEPTTPTNPTQTDPTDIIPTGTSSGDEYNYAIEACIWELNYNKDHIKSVEDIFDTPTVGIHDINNDGIPELYYLTDDKTGFSAKLVMCYYNEFAGEMIEICTIPQIIYMAADGGYFIVYSTANELIVTYAGGEESLWIVDSDVYDFNWNLKASYRRNEYYDYDPNTGDESYTYEYFKDGKQISDAEYIEVFSDYVYYADTIVASNYEPLSSEIEGPLKYKSEISMVTYDEAISYLTSVLY
jgi:hypothetical protein